MLTIASGPSLGGTSQQQQRDFQPIAELINKFIVTTAQLTNRFAARCDEKLSAVSRQLYHVECQVQLLEYKLESTEREGGGGGGGGSPTTGGGGGGASSKAAASSAGTSGGGSGGAAAKGAASGPAGAAAAAAPGGGGAAAAVKPGALVPSFGVNVPMMPTAQRGVYPPPAPNAPKGPPLPPNMQGGAAAAAGGAPPPMVVPPMMVGGVPLVPPPMLLTAPPLPPGPPPGQSFTVRTHPKLSGYFKMQQAGVPVAAIKAKMQADGYKPEWFDSPDMPSPLPAGPKPGAKGAAARTEYDSD